MHRVRASQLIGRALGQADVLDLALVHQTLERGHGLLDRGGGIHAMHVIQVDVVGAQTREGLVQLTANEVFLAGNLCRARENCQVKTLITALNDKKNMLEKINASAKAYRSTTGGGCGNAKLGADHKLLATVDLDGLADQLLVKVHTSIFTNGLTNKDIVGRFSMWSFSINIGI